MGHDTIERWLPVVGYEGLYEVSDHGRVRSLDRRSWNGKGYFLRKGRTLIPRERPDGRLDVTLHDGARRDQRLVHHLVLEAFVGPRPRGREACHYNDDPKDNRLQNLRWDTPSANQLDLIRNGRNPLVNQTHCKRGHLLAGDNLMPSSTRAGKRGCYACNRAHNYVRYRPELRAELQQVADDYYRAITSVDG